MERFNLSVIRPVKGQKGQLVCEYVAYAKTVSDAVKEVKNMFGPDYIVLQTASIATQEGTGEPSQFAKDIIAKLKERAVGRSSSDSRAMPVRPSVAVSEAPRGWDVAG